MFKLRVQIRSWKTQVKQKVLLKVINLIWVGSSKGIHKKLDIGELSTSNTEFPD